MLKKISKVMNMTEEEIWHHPKLLVAAFDHEHKVLYWNRRCEQYFGVKQDDALGRKFEVIVPYVKGSVKLTYLDRALSGEPICIKNVQYAQKKGVYDQLAIPLKNDEGKVTGALNIVIDLTYLREESSENIFSFSYDIVVNSKNQYTDFSLSWMS